MIIDIISDLHGFTPELPGGDMLIIAGDMTGHDMPMQWIIFYEWFQRQKYKKKIYIAGNHDFYLQDYAPEKEGLDYLQDCGLKHKGLRIWGSPWTPEFYDWAFMLPRGKALAEKWALIPTDTDILITHGPPHGILDLTLDGRNAGCEELRKRVDEIKPKVHIFGHVHEAAGVFQNEHTIFINAAYLNRSYKPQNGYRRLEYAEHGLR
jgi:Icc-related predicted phosphoesterase